MPRSLTSIAFAAAVATAAAFGAAGVDDSVPVAVADEAAAAEGAAAPTGAGESDAPAEVAADLAPAGPTTGLTPRVALPQRAQQIAEAPSPPEPEPVEPAPAPRSLRGTGTLLAARGTSSDPVHEGGRTVTFSVEVEEGTGLDPDDVAAVVEGALYDERSWARDHDLHRVAPGDARIEVVVATPATVDRLCARAGLNTGGWLSCWNGTVAAINLDRWNRGVGHVDDLGVYRRYVVNHEVGHGLGHGHVDCPGSGRLAPVMQQQTKSLSGCVANEWPHP